MNAQQLECKAPPYLGGGECNTKKLTKKRYKSFTSFKRSLEMGKLVVNQTLLIKYVWRF